MLVRLFYLLAAHLIVPTSAVWPLPAQISEGENNDLLIIPPTDSTPFFRVASEKLGQVETLEEAFARYTDLTFPHPASNAGEDHRDYSAAAESSRRLGRSQNGRGTFAGTHKVHVGSATRRLGRSQIGGGTLSGIIVKVEDASEEAPQLGTDESYSLTIDTQHGNNGFITAPTIYGALRGLETFSQLVYFDFDTATYRLSVGLPLSIHDAPRFSHRGLMIDTARHFLPIHTIKHALDSMSFAKLNVLHWHISDTQSFPLQFQSRPKLWNGAHSPRERYLQAEVRDVVEYARRRGIRVIPEFDVPGHAASWCTGYPEVCPSDPQCTQPLNVAHDETFQLIGDIVSECVGDQGDGEGENPLFLDEFFHFGGDEVDTTCWERDEEISAWMKDQNYTDPDEAYAYFVKRAASIAIEHGRRPVQWSEVFDHFQHKLEDSTNVHVWKSVTNVTEVAEMGYDLLVNAGYADGSWYLDNLNRAWEEVYQRSPCQGIPDDRPDLCSKVLGGHGEMWGETVDTSDFDATVWPRLAAIAERLWSTEDQTSDSATALPRIQEFRCLLNERGIAAAPVNNADARSAPPGPGSCYKQRR